ncbi:hypothetical protein CKW39_08785 [Kocuria sp. WRN011]|uniref:hypothetical protein n=1 Tax=Kocuria sp. WRN011 TaxID=2029858 RepID=UPI000BB000EB|nr:hypothetical protein [Kocuria sp. WRN011]PBB08447.1 hypothetical protein CKW39_08785 [Kocuria sp. WRN011]
MADMAKFMAALAGIGETLNRATNATQDEFLLMPPQVSADMKAAAAYHPLDPRVFKPAATFVTGTPPRSAQGRRRFLQIAKADESFLLRLPASAPENLLGRQAHRHFGDWHVQLIEDDRPFLLESFDEYDEAVAYVAHVLRTIGDEGADIEDEYASVGEVPC